MNCPNCGSPLAPGQNRCVHCGSDVAIHRDILNRSIAYFNDGLAKARVRDLSGAAVSLRESIRYDKYNINARNLLGLVYLETGDVVGALAQWVISKNFQVLDNLANEYLKQLQSSQAFLSEASQNIKKYNMALTSVRQNSRDLAVIQLKKVYGANPRFLKAGQLLTLLYMENGEYEKARRVIKKILKVDVNNTLALSYRSEIRKLEEEDEIPRDRDELKGLVDVTDNIHSAGPYKEEKPSIFIYLNLVIGIVLGLAFCFVLILPTYKTRYSQETNDTINNLSQQVAAFDSRYQSLEKTKGDLESQVEELEKELQTYRQDEEDTATAAESLEGMLKAVSMYVDGDSEEDVVRALRDVDVSKIDNKTAKDLYNNLLDKTKTNVVTAWMTKGIQQEYNNGNFRQAAETFQDVLAIDEENVEAIYYLGRSYQRLGENQKAAGYFQQIVDNYPDASRFEEAKKRLQEVQ